MPARPVAEAEAGRTAARRVGRPAGPTAQGAASREVIVDAAAGVFARLGYDRARMADIIEASGMSKGSVYFHFDSKEALAVAVLEDRHQLWIAAVESAVADVDAGQPRLSRLLPAMLSLHREDPDAWVISRLTQRLADAEPTRDLAAAVTRRWIDLVASLIREAQGVDDSAESVDAAALATVLVGAFDGLKMTVDVVGTGDRTDDGRLLAEGGAVLERMLFETVGIVPAEKSRQKSNVRPTSSRAARVP